MHCSGEEMGICVECTKNRHCDGLLSCDPRNNQCTTATIIACDPDNGGDADCSAASDDLPFCGEDAICVGCLSDANCASNVAEAICDEVDFECRGCLENAECESGLCGDDGSCADEANIVYVNNATGLDSGNCGTASAPCKTIGVGLGQVAGLRNTVLVAAGTYAERIEIADSNLALVGQGDVVVRTSLAASEQLVAISGTAAVVIENIEFGMLAAAVGADMISCSGGSARLELNAVVVNGADDIGVVGENCDLTIRESTIAASGGVGVQMTDGTLTLHASTIESNAKGGVDIDGANYSLVNNFITQNGGAASVTGGVRIEDTASRDEEFAHNTIAQNSRVSGSGIGSALRCEVASVVATNNIFMLEDASTADLVSGCGTQYSLFDASSAMANGTGNISGEAVFVDPTAKDFHLASGSPGIDAALAISTIASDVDGDPRPLGAGADMGADEVE
tara:strand:+ start:15480 stop:16838 length:1359 start_codon:yes stop_codon:yes gene_type:complete